MGLKEETIIKIIEECIKPLSGLKNGFEKQENRADEIAENLPPEKYPSVSAVIAFVKNKIEVFSEAVGKVYLKATDFEDYKTDASNTYATKTDVEEFENNVADTYATKTDVENFENNVAETYATKTDVEEFENNVADTYATKTDVENFENNVAETYATKTDVEEFENNVADTYATKTDVENFENNVAETYATKTDVENFENNVADTYATKTDVENLKTDTEVTATASGKAITIESANAPLQNLKLFGKTEQVGTPTPTEPKELKSVGDSGSFSVTVYGKNLIAITAESTTRAQITYTVNKDKGFITASGTASTADSLMICENMRKILNTGETYRFSGIFTVKIEKKDGTTEFKNGGDITITDDMVSIIPYLQPSGEWGIGISKTQTYYPMCIRKSETDTTFEPCLNKPLTMPYTLRSVGDIKDEVDFNRGVLVQRIYKRVLTENSNWQVFGAFSLDDFYNHKGGYSFNYTNDKLPNNLVTQSLAGTQYALGFNGSTQYKNYLYVSLPESVVPKGDLNAFKTWIASNHITVIYELETPIETPLTETELNAYRQLMTNSGTTTILSEADMTLDYYIPKGQALGNIHSQVNKDYLKLQQAIIETGGN